MSHRQFKAIIIRIFTGLEKRVEDMNETLNTKIRTNIAKIKDTTSEMRNTIDGMNSRME